MKELPSHCQVYLGHFKFDIYERNVLHPGQGDPPAAENASLKGHRVEAGSSDPLRVEEGVREVYKRYLRCVRQRVESVG